MRFLSTLTLALLQATYLVSSSSAAAVTSNIKNRDTPGACFSSCSNAEIEFDKVGHDVACREGSAYREHAEACTDCVESFGGDYEDFPASEASKMCV